MESVQERIDDVIVDTPAMPFVDDETAFSPLSGFLEEVSNASDTFSPLTADSLLPPPFALSGGNNDSIKPPRSERALTFDLHPLYASILQDGAAIRQGEVLGLDGDLRQALVAPFDGTIRLLVTGTGSERRVRVFLSEQKERRESFAAGRR